MKPEIYALCETEGRYYIDGKRVDQSRYDDLRRQAHSVGRMDTFYTTRTNGLVKHYCTVHVP